MCTAWGSEPWGSSVVQKHQNSLSSLSLEFAFELQQGEYLREQGKVLWGPGGAAGGEHGGA